MLSVQLPFRDNCSAIGSTIRGSTNSRRSARRGGTTPPVATADQWSGWAQVPGGGTTDVALAAAAFNNKLFLFSKGITYKRIYVNIFDTTDSWSSWSAWTHWAEVAGGGATDVALAAAASNNQLYLFAKGVNNDKLIYINTFGPAGN